MKRRDPFEEQPDINKLSKFLKGLFPDNPKTVSTILFLVRLFGYGILVKYGINIF